MAYPRKPFDLDKLEIVSVLGTIKQSSKSRVRLVIENYNGGSNYVAIYSEFKKDSEPDDEGFWKVSKKIKLAKIEFKKLLELITNMDLQKKIDII